jgi:hypothetical protein
MGVQNVQSNLSPAEVAPGPNNQSCSDAGANLSKAAVEVWHKLFNDVVKAQGGVAQALQNSLANADELALSLVGQPLDPELKKDIESNLQILEHQFQSVSSNPSQFETMKNLLDQVRIQLAFSKEALEKFVANKDHHTNNSSLRTEV